MADPRNGANILMQMARQQRSFRHQQEDSQVEQRQHRGKKMQSQDIIDEIYQLKRQNELLKRDNELFQKMNYNPPHLLHAGTILYPDRKPFNTAIRQEMLESAESNPFGTTTQGIAQATFIQL